MSSEKFILANGREKIPPVNHKEFYLDGETSWDIKDRTLVYVMSPRVMPKKEGIKDPETVVDKVVGLFDGEEVPGVYGPKGWSIQIPESYMYNTDLTVTSYIKFKIDRGPRVVYEIPWKLKAMEKYPMIKYVIGFDGFAVSRRKEGNKVEYRVASFSRLVSMAVAIPGKQGHFVYSWEKMSKMTKNGFRQFALLKDWSVVENIWEAKEDLGKEYLDGIFDEMEKEGELSRVLVMNRIVLVILNSFHEAFEFILPDPEENFTEMVAGARTLFDEKKSPMERLMGGFSMVAHAVFLVLDFLPVIGKVGKAAKILKKTDGVIEALLRHLMKEQRGLRKVLKGSSNLDNLARQRLNRAVKDLDDRIQQLEELRSKLNKPPDQLSDMEMDMLQDALETVDQAQQIAQKAKKAGLLDDAVKDTNKLVSTNDEKKEILDEIAKPFKPLTEAERAKKIERNITRLARNIERKAVAFQKTPEFTMLRKEMDEGNQEAITFFNKWREWRLAWKNRKNLKRMGPAFRWKILEIKDGKLLYKDWKKETRRAILMDPGTPRWVKGFYEEKFNREVRRLREVIASGNNAGGRITKARKTLEDVEDQEKKIEFMLNRFPELPPFHQLGHRQGDKMGQLPGVLEDVAANNHKGSKYGL